MSASPFWRLSGADEGPPAASGEPYDPHREGKLYEDWEPPLLRLPHADWEDLLAADGSWHPCSPALRSAVEAELSGEEGVVWLPMRVLSETSGEERTYYGLHLPFRRDVLHEGRTIYGPGGVIKPVVDARKAGGLAVFSFPGGAMIAFVNDALKRRIVSQGLTGIEFNPALYA